MNVSQLLQLRLRNTGLVQSPFKTAAEAVAHLGAVQSQDYAAAKWAVSLRVKNSTDAKIEKEFDNGKILRTHILRPTWHFVSPDDISWMLELTAPRVKQFLKTYDKRLELSEALYKKTNAVITKTIRTNEYATRDELKVALEKIGVKTDVQRLAHIIIWAELEALICSGPRRGKQFTYALFEDRVTKPKKLSREKALAKLALTYFTSHGPAQVKDFAWWSGLTQKDAQQALELIQSKLENETIDGKEFWFVPAKKVKARSTGAFLLSIYDEYTIAYKDRSQMSAANDIERMIKMGNAFNSVMIIDGSVVGTWKRVLKKQKAEIKLSPFRKLTKAELEAFEAEAERYGKFSELPVAVV